MDTSYNTVIVPHNSKKKAVKGVNRYFSREHIQRVGKQEHSDPTRHIVREMPIKSIMRYHFTPTRTATIKTKAKTARHIGTHMYSPLLGRQRQENHLGPSVWGQSLQHSETSFQMRRTKRRSRRRKRWEEEEEGGRRF